MVDCPREMRARLIAALLVTLLVVATVSAGLEARRRIDAAIEAHPADELSAMRVESLASERPSRHMAT